MRHFHIAAHNLPPAVRLGEAPTLSPSAIVRDCHFGRYTQVGDQSSLDDCMLDDYSYLQHYCDLKSTDVGKFANIASMVRVNPGFHPLERPTLHHFTYRRAMFGMADTDDADFFAWRRRQRVSIGHDTWIGHGVVIMPGIRIGNGAVVGSNSVVTKDVPAYAIVAGAPAKLIRQRFPRAIAAAIEATAWWDWDHETLAERMADFNDLRSFLAKYAP
ncbi:MAG: acetyltransferase [Gammaproteobacteria bacterium]|nr:acetyltransferase [Rhodocyclaceae bacterium]MBU3908803.1 acetyltransferase [Gammaproteobacteria bacterium]MBU3988412.1 acetyltransferase [Gammaproteobacteria bacterium]MBU4004831.1 acetyltransferase [Gammaproteobacteria bacterium]MBU4021434.1 acetyltransferase [Gammaproteobacteria bacterium]